jgi:SAM-dependent methyltransferase
MQKSAAKKSYLEVTYNESLVPRTSYPRKLVNYLIKRFRIETGSILDVGCGRGEFLESFQIAGFDVSGVDLSPNLDVLSKRFKVKQGDFERESLPYKDESFDYIFSKSVIEHLHQPEKLLDECYRLLKPGGKIIIMCPSWVHTYWGPFYIDHTHVTPFTLPSLRQVLKLSGFNVLESQHFIQLPFVWKRPYLSFVCEMIAFLPIPFRPLYDTSLPEPINKLVRFSKEKMLLAFAEKPVL